MQREKQWSEGGSACLSERLKSLFPPHPYRYLLCNSVRLTDSEKIQKQTVTIKAEATLERYATHLSEGSRSGKGALGLHSALPVKVAERWKKVSYWFAVDYDPRKPGDSPLTVQDATKLVALLESYGLYLYLDQGTTGRGIHGYVFLQEPITQQLAYEAAKTIQSLSSEVGLPKAEIFPSDPHKVGKGLFLPYRAAEEDGYGVNPLIDPVGGEMISLQRVQDEVYRSGVSSVAAFIKDFANPLTGVSSTQGEGQYSTIPVHTSEGALEAWKKEIERLKPEWYMGRRNHLALGLSAYGLMALGVSYERIKEDLNFLEMTSSLPEPEERIKALDQTLNRYLAGKRIAWIHYYESADVPSPPSTGMVSWKVRKKLLAFSRKFKSVHCKGTADLTDFDVVETLIDVGMRYGQEHPDGVEVSISRRQLTPMAEIGGGSTTGNAVERLTEKGWLITKENPVKFQADSFVLLIDQKTIEDFDVSLEGNVDLPKFHIPRFRWGSGKLGKLTRLTLVHLQKLQPCTRADIARAMGRESRSIKSHIRKLLERDLIKHEKDTNTYTIVSDFDKRIEEVFEEDGTNEARLRQAKRIEMERLIYQFRINPKIDEPCNNPCYSEREVPLEGGASFDTLLL